MAEKYRELRGRCTEREFGCDKVREMVRQRGGVGSEREGERHGERSDREKGGNMIRGECLDEGCGREKVGTIAIRRRRARGNAGRRERAGWSGK